VANKPLESLAWRQLWYRRHVDHDKFQLIDDRLRPLVQVVLG
jgi:hypothetical protein